MDIIRLFYHLSLLQVSALPQEAMTVLIQKHSFLRSLILAHRNKTLSAIKNVNIKHVLAV